jgi:tetratricopeptide (TPR) repeat protein
VNGIDTLISTASGAIGGGLTGAIAALVGWRTLQHTVERDKVQDYFASYEKRIGNLEKACTEAAEGSSQQEQLKAKLGHVRDEYDERLQAWQQKQQLATLVPRGVVAPDAPRLTADVVEQVRALLAGSARLPPALLSVDDYIIRGNAYYEASEYQQALEAYNRALDIRPDDPDTLYNHGNALQKLERHEEALKDYNRALELRPDFAKALNNRAAALMLTGEYVDALKDCDHALQLEPGHPTALYNRACTYSRMGQLEEALRDLEAAIAGDEDNRQIARTDKDKDFEGLRNDPKYGPRFRKLVGE